jgi:hypothetical protein
VVTTVGEGVVLTVVELAAGVVVGTAMNVLEDTVEVVDVVDRGWVELGGVLSTAAVEDSEGVDGTDVALDGVLATTTIDDTDVVSGSNDELSELVSLVEGIRVVNDGNPPVLPESEVVNDGGVAVKVEVVVGLATDVTLSGCWNGEPVPSQ